MKHVKLFEQFVNESLRSDLKKFINKNEEELNKLADDEMWDKIETMLYTEFDVEPGSREAKDILDAFMMTF